MLIIVAKTYKRPRIQQMLQIIAGKLLSNLPFIKQTKTIELNSNQLVHNVISVKEIQIPYRWAQNHQILKKKVIPSSIINNTQSKGSMNSS